MLGSFTKHVYLLTHIVKDVNLTKESNKINLYTLFFGRKFVAMSEKTSIYNMYIYFGLTII